MENGESKGIHQRNQWKAEVQDNPNERRASTSQGTQDKSKIRCYECGEHGHFAKHARGTGKTTNSKQKKLISTYDLIGTYTAFDDKPSFGDYGMSSERAFDICPVLDDALALLPAERSNNLGFVYQALEAFEGTVFRYVSRNARHVCWLPGEDVQVSPEQGCCVLGPETIAHSSGIILLLRNVTIPPSTGNFNIPCAVDGTARIFLIPGMLIIPLCGDGDLMTIKFIHAEVECSSSPILTNSVICPNGQMVSPLNPMSGVVAGTIWFFIYGWSLMKQCSYKTSEDAPPSIYIRCTKCPPISASMIIGPFVPSSSPRGREGNCCLQREGLGDPLFGNLFPWLDHQDGQWLVLSGGFPLLRQPWFVILL
ncbi:reverse transcriptase domain-containing protein [Tanacetum coccineum]